MLLNGYLVFIISSGRKSNVENRDSDNFTAICLPDSNLRRAYCH
jgi:hypothetical protein